MGGEWPEPDPAWARPLPYPRPRRAPPSHLPFKPACALGGCSSPRRSSGSWRAGCAEVGARLGAPGDPMAIVFQGGRVVAALSRGLLSRGFSAPSRQGEGEEQGAFGSWGSRAGAALWLTSPPDPVLFNFRVTTPGDFLIGLIDLASLDPQALKGLRASAVVNLLRVRYDAILSRRAPRQETGLATEASPAWPGVRPAGSREGTRDPLIPRPGWLAFSRVGGLGRDLTPGETGLEAAPQGVGGGVRLLSAR